MDRVLDGWQARRLAKRNRLECGLRVVDGSLPGLSRRWRHGIAGLSQGEISFRPFLPPGVRIYRPFARQVNVSVQWIASEPRKVNLREAWSVLPGLDVLTVTTPDARIEWAVSPGLRPWALDLVQR